MRIFSGIQPTGDKHLGNYIGGFRQYAQTQELGEAFFCIVDLHSITVEYDPARPARPHPRPVRDADRDRARPRAVDGLRAEPRHGARRGELAALGRHLVRPARPDDPVQGQGRPARVRLRGPVHLPGADGGRHPPLPRRPRADRRRPAPAPRARPRRRGAVQRALRRDLRRPRGHLPGGRRADHGPPGADPEDVDDRRHRAGHGEGARRLGCDPEEVPLGGDGLGSRDPARRRQARGLEPRRHPRGRDAAHPRGDRGGVRGLRLRRPQARRRRGGRRAARRRCGSATSSCAATRASSCACSRSVRTRRARRRRPRSRRCTRGWGS